MTDVAALIADMVRAGVDPEIIGRTAAALAEREPVRIVDDQAERRRAKDRERKRLRNSAESAEIPPPSAPRQKAPQTPKKTHPLSPPTPPIVPPPPSSDELADRLWSLANKASRGRSTRPETRRATASALAAGATPSALEASIVEHGHGAGEFAKGVHRIIAGELWRDHDPRPLIPPKPPSAEQQAHRLRHFRSTGEWREDWGERPTILAA